jgi:hypothetical protein
VSFVVEASNFNARFSLDDQGFMKGAHFREPKDDDGLLFGFDRMSDGYPPDRSIAAFHAIEIILNDLGQTLSVLGVKLSQTHVFKVLKIPLEKVDAINHHLRPLGLCLRQFSGNYWIEDERWSDVPIKTLEISNNKKYRVDQITDRDCSSLSRLEGVMMVQRVLFPDIN